MKHVPITKLDKRNKTTPKKFDDNLMLENCDVIVIFLIYGQFGTTWKPDSRRIGCKTNIFINSSLLSYKNWKQIWKIFNRALTLLLSNDTIFPKKSWFFAKKMLTPVNLREPWYSEVYFLRQHMCVYLRTKFQAPSIILTSFRRD